MINEHALFKNTSETPLIVRRYSHFRPHPVEVSDLTDILDLGAVSVEQTSKKEANLVNNSSFQPIVTEDPDAVSQIHINKEVLSSQQLSRLSEIHRKYSEVFNDDLRKGYNHKAGGFYADFTFTNKPPPTRVFSPQYNKRCTDLQQSKCDELEAQGVLVDPKLHGIPVLHVSPSWIQQKGKAKHKSLQECTLDELRFITAFNSLNDSIRPKPTMSCSANTIFKFLASWECHIFADLSNSYFQLPVKKKLWSYLGVQTPHKGVRVMTRTGQGLLGSDVELGELLSRVLGEDIASGHCVAIRDDIIIGGKDKNEAISNYESVLGRLHASNLKLSPRKVRIFPADTEVYGYRVINGCILPSSHTVTSLGQTKMEDLTTIKHVNSWKGLYKTLIGHLPALSSVMSPFDTATAGKQSNEKFNWTPTLTSAYNEAMNHLGKINKTYLPKPDEQLILLPDAMSSEPCIGWLLYVKRNQKLLPVSFCTAKLKDYMKKWFPCEKEAVGVVISLDQCSHWINESKLPTLVGPDCQAVVKATELIRKGGHSTNPRMQSLLACVNRRNIRFFHNSAKQGLHIVPDHLSRMKDRTCHSKDCAIERFLTDIPVTVQAMNLSSVEEPTSLLSLCLQQPIPTPAVIAASSQALEDHLLKRAGPIPLGSRQTWMEIQKSDSDCQAVYHMKLHGEAPRRKSTNPNINRIYKECTIDKGILVVRSFDERKMREIERVVIPPSFLDSILTVLHLKLNHPKLSQLRQVFERYFFSPKTEKALSNLYEACHICKSFKRFPKDLETYNPSLFPEHPGIHMNIDILKRAKQLIVVNVDLFSFYVTSCFSASEKAEDIARAILQVTTPIRRSGTLQVRVDKAPCFKKLAADKDTLLTQVGISLILADDDNKNSNCSVDKAIDELEQELRKLSPDGKQLDEGDLSQATLILNSKIRKRGLTSSEIHFSRDAYDNSNLQLDDEKLQSQQKRLRLQNHQHLAKSRNPRGVVPSPIDIKTGDIVFTKNSGSKHDARDLHIVTKSDDTTAKVSVRKALHASHFSSNPLNISPQVKLVSNKFVFKLDNRQSFEQDSREQQQDHLYLSSPAYSPPLITTQKWDPVAVNEENDGHLIPITDMSPDNIPLEGHNSTDCSQHASIDNLGEGINDETANSNEIDESEILIFDDGEEPFLEERLIQDRTPKVNDHISFYDEHRGEWVSAMIIRDLSRRWKHYFNI